MTNTRLKVVFDTNVYIAAALNPAGSSEAWLRIAGRQQRSFDLFTSIAILDEVEEKLTHKFGIEARYVERFIDGIREVAIIVLPAVSIQVVRADPDDDMLFECAITAKAQLVVSAGKEVLKLSPYNGIGVCHPSDLKSIFAKDLKYI